MNEKTIAVKRIYSGRVLDFELLEVELEDGRRTEREVVRHHGAVGVLVRHPDGRMLFVRQFRKPVDCHCLEIVAGLIETGETPEDCAVRELSEETGYVANSIEELGDVMLTPGYSDERIHLFFAEVDGSRREQSLDPDEHVELVAIDAQDINRQVAEGIITDGKTLAALLLYRIKLQ